MVEKKKFLVHTKNYVRHTRIKILLFAIIFILLAAIITCFIYCFLTTHDIHRCDYYITVTQEKEVGLSIDTDALYFGKIPQGCSCERYVNITNSNIKPLKVIITFSGSCSKWITPEDNFFILNPNETKTISITADVPKNALPGDYKGTMSTLFKKL